MSELLDEGDSPRLRLRIGTKVSFAIAVVALALVGLLGWLLVRTQRAIVVEDAMRGAAMLSDTIRRSTHHAMLEDRRSEAYRIMEAVAAQPGIERVRIFNKEGTITWSTDAGEIGHLVDKRAESCYACHAADQPIARLSLPSRGRLYDANGHRVVGMVTPIYNEPSCSTAACHAHPPRKTVLGVVDIGISMAEADTLVARLARSTLALAALTIVLLAATVTLSTQALVGRPVGELEAATRRIAEGNLDEPVRVHSHDELGLLAGSFDRMRAALAEARAEIRQLLAGLEQKVADRTLALREAQEQLAHAEKMASLGRLSASIAHEINNPLAGILTFAKLLIRDVEADGGADDPARERVLRHLRLVERETERCTAIVRNLLEFARQKPLLLQPVDLNVAVDEALSLLGNQLALKGLTLERHTGPLPRVRADLGQLRQAVVNIVMNACDATPSGGCITVGTAAHGEAVELVVSDTGGGISAENVKKIFDPFFSTKEKGTGLGLSVVYGIVQRHGGAIDVRSEPGRGTTFRIRLPLAAAMVQSEPA